MKKLLIIAMLLVLLLLVGCAEKEVEDTEDEVPPADKGDATPPAEQGDKTPPADEEQPELAPGNVEIKDSKFVPEVITVKKGASVTWTNKDDVNHIISSSVFYMKKQTLAKDDSISFEFKNIGEFEYICAVYPHVRGKVIVEE